MTGSPPKTGSGPPPSTPRAATDVVLDTNGLLLPFTDGTDLEEELARLVGSHETVVPVSVAEELAGLREGGGGRARAASAALQLLERCRMEPTDLPGDDGVLDVARRLGAVVVTNDRVLQQECRRSGLRVLRSQGRGRLMEVL